MNDIKLDNAKRVACCGDREVTFTKREWDWIQHESKVGDLVAVHAFLLERLGVKVRPNIPEHVVAEITSWFTDQRVADLNFARASPNKTKEQWVAEVVDYSEGYKSSAWAYIHDLKELLGKG